MTWFHQNPKNLWTLLTWKISHGKIYLAILLLSGALISLEIVQNVGAYLNEHGPHTVLIQSWASEATADHDNGLAIYFLIYIYICVCVWYIYICVYHYKIFSLRARLQIIKPAKKKLIYHYSNIKNIINLAVPFLFHMYPTSTQRRLQGLHDKLLHFGHIFLLQILQSHAEGGLQHTIIQATTNDTRAQTAVYQGFVERACSSAHHQVIQEPGTDGLQVTFLLEKYVQKEAGITSSSAGKPI